MFFTLVKEDIDTLVKKAVKGKVALSVKSMSDNELVFNLIFPKQATISLADFHLSSDTLSARINPWLVRKIVSVMLKKNSLPAEIDGERLYFTIPEEVNRRLRFQGITITSKGLTVKADVREI